MNKLIGTLVVLGIGCGVAYAAYVKRAELKAAGIKLRDTADGIIKEAVKRTRESVPAKGTVITDVIVPVGGDTVVVA